MLFRWGNPFGRADSIYALPAAAVAMLRAHIALLDRRHHRISVLIERRA